MEVNSEIRKMSVKGYMPNIFSSAVNNFYFPLQLYNPAGVM